VLTFAIAREDDLDASQREYTSSTFRCNASLENRSYSKSPDTPPDLRLSVTRIPRRDCNMRCPSCNVRNSKNRIQPLANCLTSRLNSLRACCSPMSKSLPNRRIYLVCVAWPRFILIREEICDVGTLNVVESPYFRAILA
jgi:hypothetical protein